MDAFASGSSVKLGSVALEEILCRVTPVGVLGNLVPHAIDAWSIEFPNLDALPRFEGDPARLRNLADLSEKLENAKRRRTAA